MRDGEDVIDALKRIQRKEAMYNDDFYETIDAAISAIEDLRGPAKERVAALTSLGL